MPESAVILCAMVGENIFRYAVAADHEFETHSSQFRWVDVHPAWNVDRHPSQLVNQYQDPSVCWCRWFGQISDEIHCNFFPQSMGCWQWHIGSVACAPRCLDLVAYIASGNVLSYRHINCGPVEISSCEFSSSKGSKVAIFGIVMKRTYHFAAERFWYIYPPCICQGSWDDFLIHIRVRFTLRPTILCQVMVNQPLGHPRISCSRREPARREPVLSW